MLFQKIFDIAQETTLAMTFSANREAGTLVVTVIPKAMGENVNPALHQPLQFEATPEELESGFAEALGSYSASRKSLADALNDTERVIAAAKKEATTKATKALKGSPAKAGANGEKPSAPAAQVTVVPPAAGNPEQTSGTGTPAADNLFA